MRRRGFTQDQEQWRQPRLQLRDRIGVDRKLRGSIGLGPHAHRVFARATLDRPVRTGQRSFDEFAKQRRVRVEGEPPRTPLKVLDARFADGTSVRG